MKVLVVHHGNRFEAIVQGLRTRVHVDFVCRGPRLGRSGDDVHVPELFGKQTANRILTLLVVQALLLKNRYDICFVEQRASLTPGLFLLVKRLFPRSFRTRFVHDFRTIPVEYPERLARSIEKRFLRKLRFAHRYYQGVTFITEEMSRHVQQRYLEMEKPTGIWESGVDPQRFLPPDPNEATKERLGFRPEDFVCFYHGSLAENRGVLELVRAFSILRDREPAVKLFVLGSGTAYGEIERTVHRLDLRDTVTLKRWIPHPLVPEFIGAADLCVVPLPDNEWWRVSSPLKLMEYIACGKNILLSDIVAHRNVVGHDSRYIFLPEVQEDALAGRILEAHRAWREDPEAYRQRGLRERRVLLDTITWERRARDLEVFFQTLLER